MCSDFLGDAQGLLVGDRLHFAGSEGFEGCAVVAEVQLGADQNDGDIGGVVFNFWEPLRESAFEE